MHQRTSFLTMFMYVILVFLIVGLAVIVFLNVMANKDLQEQRAAEIAAAMIPATPAPTPVPEATPEPVRNTEDIVLRFAGDILGHKGLTSDARIQTNAGEVDDNGDPATPEYIYDFYEEIAAIEPLLEGADMTSCTLASTLMDAEEYGDYLMPRAFAKGLAEVGFQLVNTASDHILDQELTGLQSTVASLEERALTNLGTAPEESRFQGNSGIYTKVIDGVTFAFLSYTWGTGNMSAADYPYAVNILTTDYMSGQSTVDYDRLSSDLSKAKNMGADMVVCYVYWGANTNYYTDIRDEQKTVADYLCQNGADIIIGGGVKVPQPIELQKIKTENGYKNCVVAYSLGSLVSGFVDSNTNLSMLLDVKLQRDLDSGEIWIENVSYQPLFMLFTSSYDGMPEEVPFRYRLMDLRDSLDRYEAVNEGREDADAEALAADCITQSVYEAMGQGALRLQEIVGAEYEALNGGVDVPEWSDTVVVR